MVKNSHHQTVIDSLARLNSDSYPTHCRWMESALELARTAGNSGEVPVGAVIVDRQGNILAKAANRKITDIRSYRSCRNLSDPCCLPS